MSIIGTLLISGLIGAEYSNRLDEQSRKKFTKAYEIQYEAQDLVEKKKIQTDNSMMKLANRKRAILSTSINDFIELYSKIKKINFKETSAIKDLERDLNLIKHVEDMEKMVLITKAAVKMTDADVVKAYLISGPLGAMFVKDSKQNLKIANSQVKISNVIYEQAKTVEIILNGIIQRCESYSDLLTHLNMFFVRSIRSSNQIISKNLYDKNLYTDAERKTLMTCMNIASSIKNLMDVPILDEHGIITQKSFEALETGNKFLNEIQIVLKEG